jgi:uncharacterized protein (DUF1499 family)
MTPSVSRRRWARIGALIAAILLVAACSGSPPATLGPTADGLAPCPDRPNCVHTGHRHPDGTTPFLLADTWADAPDDSVFPELADAIRELPRTRIVRQEGDYLHAEASSRIFRFVDDLELHRPSRGDEVVVRSAARMGRSDMGVNPARVEALRFHLLARGVIRP